MKEFEANIGLTDRFACPEYLIYKSSCCNAEVKTQRGDSGSWLYVCTKCGRAV